MSKETPIEEVIARVYESLPNTLFRVTVEKTNENCIAYLSGKIRMNRIKILIGDRVSLILDSAGGKARIIKRL